MKQRITAVPRKRQNVVDGLLSIIGMGNTFYTPKAFIDIELTETEGPALTEICKINLTASGELVTTDCKYYCWVMLLVNIDDFLIHVLSFVIWLVFHQEDLRNILNF